MDYKVVVTEDAETDLDNFVRYLLFVKKNEQAAENLLNDFEITKQSLAHVAGSLKDCVNQSIFYFFNEQEETHYDSRRTIKRSAGI